MRTTMMSKRSCINCIFCEPCEEKTEEGWQWHCTNEGNKEFDDYLPLCDEMLDEHTICIYWEEDKDDE